MSYIIGIGGGSGSGKTTLANRLKDIFKDQISVIQYDHYCNDQSHLTMEQRLLTNYDTPMAYDSELLFKHINDLKNNLSIERPCYIMSEHNRGKETVTINPSKIIIIEGIMFFPIDKVFNDLDYKIFMDASEDRRFKRRKERDIKERGRSEESVIKQFYSSVKPMHDLYVEPYKNKVDFVFDNDNDDGLDEKQVQKIVDLINKTLK